MTEQETCTAVYAIIKEGAEIRRKGGYNQYPGNTLKHMLSAQGWLTEDLRIALMKADPAYATAQASFGQGLSDSP